MLSKFLSNKKFLLVGVFVFLLFLTGLQIIKVNQIQAIFCGPDQTNPIDCTSEESVDTVCCPESQPYYLDGSCVSECPVSCLPDQVLVEVDCDGNTLSPAQCCSQDYPEWDDGCVEACPPDYMYGNDNAIVPICAGTPPHYTDQCDQPDENRSICERYGLDWTANGYVTVIAPEETYGHAKCCGDDSYEHYTSCATNNDILWGCGGDDNNTACCPYDNQFCVKNGKCYTYNRAYGGLNSGNDDNYAYCIEGPSEIEWSDCDDNYASCGSSICGSTLGVLAGESGVGEYAENGGGLQCCEDDADEYYASNGYCYISQALSPDGPSPTVESLSASPSPICSGDSSTVSWEVSSNGGADLEQVEVWQCELTRDADCSDGGRDWEENVACRTSVSGDSASGSCSVNPTISTKYGIHAVNIYDNYGTEDTPVTVTVNDAPDAPTDLTFTDVTQTSATLNWTDNSSDESGFKIHRDGSLVHTTNADVTTWTDSSLSANTTYTYTITAYNDCEPSNEPASGSVTTLEAAECDDDTNCDPTICTNQCIGYKWTTYEQAEVENTCVGGNCTSNLCSIDTQTCNVSTCGAECYEGSHCDTTTDVCACESGYESDGSGGCQAVAGCENDNDCDDDVCSTQQCDALGDYTY